MNSALYIGLLSGTSMDAIDAAIVSFNKDNEDSPSLLASINHPIPNEFKTRCLDIAQSEQGTIDDYGQLDAIAGELFADAVLNLLNTANIPAKKIKAIGSHGQTIRHRPNAKPPFTIQIGDPNIISERTQIPTIADFRRRDLAAGGQGAPLAPAFHAAFFGSRLENRVIVNIGGIANISILPKNANQPLIGFDSGPGNCLMDAWCKQNWEIPFDLNGLYAAAGQIHNELLNHFLQDDYFQKNPPKSTGREYFNLRWLTTKINTLQNADTSNIATNMLSSTTVSSTTLSSEDIQATLLALSSQSIATAIHQFAPKDSKIFVSGGGGHNPELMKLLSQDLPHSVQTIDALGFPIDWIEALLFAWLAKQTLAGKSGNCPTVTGARHAIPLGGIFGYCPST